MSDEEPPLPLWGRQAWEKPEWFEMFTRYYLPLHPPRSKSAAYRAWRTAQGRDSDTPEKIKSKKASGYFYMVFQAQKRDGSLVHPEAVSWEVRARAWDEHCAKEARELWEQRRGEIPHKEWDVAELLVKRVAEMLAIALPTRKITDGDHVYYEPVGWGMGTAGQLAEIASKLFRRATELPSDSAEVKHTGAIAVVSADVSGMSDEELDDEISRLAKRFEGKPGAVIPPFITEGE